MRLPIITLTLLAAACSSGADRNELENRQAAPDPSATETGQPATADNRAKPEQPAADPGNPAAAAAVLRRYFAQANAGRWDEADELWWDNGRAEAFAAELRRFGDFQTNIAAPQRVEGAAGSLYVDIAFQILSSSRSGTTNLADGAAVLRRVNDVPGSTAEQRRWRIDRIALQRPPEPLPAGYRFIGRWATEEGRCSTRAWRFTADRLTTPAGSVCSFRRVREVPGGYDIAARCTAEGPPTNDTLRLRFAESAKALLFKSNVIADAGLVRCR